MDAATAARSAGIKAAHARKKAEAAAKNPVAAKPTNAEILKKGMDLYNFRYDLIDLSLLTDPEKEELYHVFMELEKWKEGWSIKQWFPDDGPFRRELYTKHMEFFKAGATKTERLFLAGNRCGKSVTAAVEVAYHATGLYPDWWEGYRYTKDTLNIYASGKTAKNTRDICQFKLLGPYNNLGSGTIPRHTIIGQPVSKPGVPQAYELCHVQHHNKDGDPDGIATINFKSYDQGQEAFMGTEVDLAWEDEEPPEDVHGETLVRLMTTNGLLILTFTPLEGMTNVVTSYLDADLQPDTSLEHVHVTTCGWDDVPHLSEEQKAKLLSRTPPHLREARSKGIPSLGSGAVYPVPEDQFKIDPFPLPDYWPRAYGMDVGWKRTAVVWGALDRETDILYVYDEYYKGQDIPAVHAASVKSRGAWLQGACDFAGVNLDDGSRMSDKYIAQGLLILPADKAVEAGIFEIYQRLVTGRLKVFSTCVNFWKEFRLYQRDKNGKVVKANDHLMDAVRYLAMSIHSIAKTKPVGLGGFDRRSRRVTGRALGNQVAETRNNTRWAM